MTTVTFSVWRGDKDGGRQEEYQTEIGEGMVVLDAVHQIQAESANDLAVSGERAGGTVDVEQRWFAVHRVCPHQRHARWFARCGDCKATLLRWSHAVSLWRPAATRI